MKEQVIYRLSVFTLCFLTTITNLSHAAESAEIIDVLNQIAAPRVLNAQPTETPIVIAIVDDGFNTQSPDLNSMLWVNPNEVAGNRFDDDSNGRVDDVSGWDVSDRDADVNPVSGRRAEFYHGTRMAGTLGAIFYQAFGERAMEFVRLLPVKAVPDDAQPVTIRNGYEGIEYAIEAGADIVLCSWSLNRMSEEEKLVLDAARQKGVLIVASAGNLPQELDMYPAAHPDVLAVSASDTSGGRLAKATWGQFVDLLAPGKNISDWEVAAVDNLPNQPGTSFSAALVAAAAGLVKLQYPQLSPAWLKACLVSTAIPGPQTSPEYIGKQGAGVLNVAGAMQCPLLKPNSDPETSLDGTRGFINLSTKGRETRTWIIDPQGEFSGMQLRFTPDADSSAQATLKLLNANAKQPELLAGYQLEAVPDEFFLPATSVRIELDNRKRGDAGGLLEYQMETIDFSSRYCQGTIQVQEEGLILDGSGEQPYSGASDCKWQVTAPAGKVVQFEFEKFDTEAKTDFIYFFNGSGTHEDIMARFSGPDIPPTLTSWSNHALVWFVTDRINQGQGWKVRISFIDSSE